jgi:hypothetical protein
MSIFSLLRSLGNFVPRTKDSCKATLLGFKGCNPGAISFYACQLPWFCMQLIVTNRPMASFRLPLIIPPHALSPGPSVTFPVPHNDVQLMICTRKSSSQISAPCVYANPEVAISTALIQDVSQLCVPEIEIFPPPSLQPEACAACVSLVDQR